MKDFKFTCLRTTLCAALLCFLAAPAGAGEVSYFSLDGDLTDPVSANDGTWVNEVDGTGPVFVTGYDGTPNGAVLFDETLKEYIVLAQTAGLPLRNNPAFSVAMWVKGPAQEDNRVFSESNTGNNTPLYNIGTDNTGATGALDIFIREDGGTRLNHYKTARGAFDDTWHHIAVVDDNGSMTLYIDGVQEGMGPNYTRDVFSADTTTLGGILRGTSCCWYTGAIDEVHLYDHALTAAEVASLVTPPGDIVPNAGFEGTTGAVVQAAGGIVNLLSGGVPDSWRAFAVGDTSVLDIEAVPLAANEIAAGTPATNAVLVRLVSGGADQGFDDDNGRFPLSAALTYQASFYVKSANADGSDQTFNLGFPIFDAAGTYLGVEPGSQGGLTATSEWQLITAPSFVPPPATAQGHLSWRVMPDGGGAGSAGEGAAEEDAILIALPAVTAACIETGNVTCDGIDAAGPGGENTPGLFDVTANVTTVGDPASIQYVFVLKNPAGDVVQYVGPQPSNQTQLSLPEEGQWTIEAYAADTLYCLQTAAFCSLTIEVLNNPPRMIAHYPLDGDLVDATGNGNDGSFVGYVKAPFVTGYDCTYPGAVTFDGVDDEIVLAQADGLPLHQNPAYSVAMWVKGDVQKDKRVFSEGYSGGNNPLINIGTHNQGADGTVDLYFRGDDGTAVLNHAHSTGVAFDGTWHHIAWTDANGAAVLYIDGVADATDFTYTKPLISLDRTTLGGILRAAPCCWFNGQIDEVGFYNYALSADEAAALAATPPECPPESPQLPGDANQDGARDISDVLSYIAAIYPGFLLLTDSPPLPCDGDATSVGNLAVLDINGDGVLNISEPVYLANWIFIGGPPPAQGPGCILIPDTLGCSTNAGCP